MQCYAKLILWLLLQSSVAAATERFIRYDGDAFDLDSGRPIYQELHFVHQVAARLRERIVLYTCPGHPKQAFARKLLTVSSDPLLPRFELIDQRLGYREGVRMIDGKLHAFVQSKPDAPEQSAPIEQVQGLVADAGFDAFVRQNWDELLSGAKLRFDFLVPSELDYQSFRVKRLGPTQINGLEAETFRLSLSGLLGLVAPSIDVSYDVQQRQLLNFEGISNVRGVDGKNYRARISFPPERLRELPDRSALDQARSIALVSSCP